MFGSAHSVRPWKRGLSRVGRLERASRVVPIAVDPEQAYKARQREGMVSQGEALQHEITQFVHDAHTVGAGTPPPQVLDELRLKSQLDHELHAHAENADGKFDYMKAVKITARMYDEKHGGHDQERAANEVSTVAQAHARYNVLRKFLYPYYARWNRVVEHAIDARLEGGG
jgi:hypothetical protein